MELHYFVAITLPNHIKEVLSNYKEEMQEELPFRSWVHKRRLSYYPFVFR